VGFPPFDGADAFSVGYKQVHEQPVALGDVDSRVPAELSAIVMRCLAKAPSSRFASGNELADALIRFLRGISESTVDYRSALLSRRAGISSPV
jgi:serine/threonine-protein kinase